MVIFAWCHTKKDTFNERKKKKQKPKAKPKPK